MKVYFHPDQKLHTLETLIDDGKMGVYQEIPERIESILKALATDSSYQILQPPLISTDIIGRVHTPDYIAMLQNSPNIIKDDEIDTPTMFRYDTRLPYRPILSYEHISQYCFDGTTGIMSKTWQSALASASSAYAACQNVIKTGETTFGLCRPPGHHAAENRFGGYCYLNNQAICIKDLIAKGYKVLDIDIDTHHGNGTQSIFYDNPNVYTVSFHGDPVWNYPYLSGYEDEIGVGAGKGTNRNRVYQKGCPADKFIQLVMDNTLDILKTWKPDYLVISAGFDTEANDPEGTLSLGADDYSKIGTFFNSLGLPTLILGEGGYNLITLGDNTKAFLDAFK
jgi:acetoin utilization deacetylase AcuC-like enzyme